MAGRARTATGSAGSCCGTTRDAADRTRLARPVRAGQPRPLRPLRPVAARRRGGTGSPPGRTGFANLAIAGDWTACGFDAGCLEAATRSGVLAARAVLSGAVGPGGTAGTAA